MICVLRYFIQTLSLIICLSCQESEKSWPLGLFQRCSCLLTLCDTRMISKLKLPLSSCIVSAWPPVREETSNRDGNVHPRKKLHSGSGCDFQITLQSTVKCYPVNSKVSKAGLQKQLLKAAALSCSGRVGQTRRREDVGRNSQVKAEAELVREWRVPQERQAKQVRERSEMHLC